MVKIPAVGHPFCIGKIVLIPASAQNPAISCVVMILQTLNHFLKTSCVLMKRCHVQGIAVAEQMHMAVVKSGTDEPVLKIDTEILLRCQCQSIFRAADKGKGVRFHNEGFEQRQLPCVNLCVVVNGFHENHQLLRSLIGRIIIAVIYRNSKPCLCGGKRRK